MVNPKKIIIGTRHSPLALAQAHWVKKALEDAHGHNIDVALKPFKTQGDKILDRSLELVGGKGLFTEELNQSLYDGSIHIAVHSMKDLETILPENIAIIAVPLREDPRDAFISPQYKTIENFPEDGIIGTASLRRKAQCKVKLPHCETILFRGNVNTRLKKLDDKQADATLLAYCGLKRLGYENKATQIFEVHDFVPAIAQGALAITARDDLTDIKNILQPLHHEQSYQQTSIERHLLLRLDGSCHTPIAGHAIIHADDVLLYSFYEGTRTHVYRKDRFSLRDYTYHVDRIAEEILKETS